MIVVPQTATELSGNIAETVIVALVVAVAVFAATCWRRLVGGVVLFVSLVLAAMLYLEFADPATAGGIEIAYGAQLLFRLRLLSWFWASTSVIAFVLGVVARARKPRHDNRFGLGILL